MDFVALINQHFEQLNKQEKDIVSYLQQYNQSLHDLTTQSLAEACFVSRSSIYRLLKKLHLDSFAELKYSIKKSRELESRNSHSNFLQVVQNYHAYIDQIFEKLNVSPIVDLLLRSEVLYLYGTGNEQKLEVEMFRQLFSSIGKKIIVFFDMGEHNYLKEKMNKADLLIILSYKGERQEGIDLLIDSQLRGIKRLVFTRTSRNTMAQLADYCLYVPTESIQTPTKLTYEVSTTFYFIIDQLFYDYLAACQEEQKCL